MRNMYDLSSPSSEESVFLASHAVIEGKAQSDPPVDTSDSELPINRKESDVAFLRRTNIDMIDDQRRHRLETIVSNPVDG